MNAAHLHLALNHLPIVIPFVALIVLTVGFVFKSEIVKRTAYFIFILAAISTVAAFTTGEEAEEIVEHLPGVSHDLIHEHEEIAETFALLMYLLGGLSVIGLWANFKQKAYANYVGYAIFILTAVNIYFANRTGNTGGEIMHQEIREGFEMPEHDEHEEHEEHED
jgi:uncharacterized membrane protein